MPEFEVSEIRKGFYSIEQGHVRCFLIEGTQEALLVDTGLGGGDLKALAESLVRQPLRVICTHADGDHVGHAGQFERCFMHPAEFDYYRQKAPAPVEMTPIWEGDIIDLGGDRFEVVLIPGHTPGSIALLERRQRFLIGGDSIQNDTIFMFGNGRNFPAYRASLQKMQRLSAAFDTVYAAHGDIAVPAALIPVLDQAAARVMAGEIDGLPNGRGFDERVRLYRTGGVAFFATAPESSPTRGTERSR